MVGKMAFMRGRSHSTRPVSKRPPNWVVYQPDEVKALIINLSREGRTQSEIGNILRDDWQKIWNHPLAVSIRKREYVEPKCKDCPQLQICGGGCPLELSKANYICAEA